MHQFHRRLYKLDVLLYFLIQVQSQKSELTGEPETLVGRIDKTKMGAKVYHQKPVKPIKQRRTKDIQIPEQKKNDKHVLNQKIDDTLLYRPRTKQNRIVYENILAKLYTLLEDQPQEILYSIADEVLAVIKDQKLSDKQKKSQVESLIGQKIKPEYYIDLIGLIKNITDYKIEGLEEGGQQLKTAVLFDEEDDADSYQDQIQQQEEQEQQQGGQRVQIQGNNKRQEQQSKAFLDPTQIDAQWLQNQLGKNYDPIQVQRLEKQILGILKVKSNIQCEDKLLGCLSYDKHQLIKLLLRNRNKIYYCIKLAQTQNQKQKQVIVEQMKKTQEGEELLAAIYGRNKIQKQDSSKPKQQEIYQFQNVKEQDITKVTKKILNLDQLENPEEKKEYKFKLPEGSTKFQHKGYEEVHIPAKKVKIDEKLVRIEQLPQWMQTCFPNVKRFNPVQSRVLHCALYTPKNMLICAPTSSGKTNIAMLAILHTMSQYMNQDGTFDTTRFKIVYIAPMKALVAEITANLSARLKGIVVKELTGDMQLSKQQINQTQIIVSTPEKWDIITRKAGDRLFTQLVKLIIIDQIHLLGDARGPVLESIIARTIRQIQATQQLVRIVGLSATLPNYQDIATVLRVQSQQGLYYFDNTYRPIPLDQIYIAITEKKGVRKLLMLNEILYEKVIQRCANTQILVFVHSRRDTIRTARTLRQMAFAKDQLSRILRPDSQSKNILQAIVQKEKIDSADLKQMLIEGIGIHHAGLSRGDRDLVEQLYADRHLSILVSTATLAWGVNLPAHTVIIKGTQVYSPQEGKWIQLSQQDLMQMMGRAGRPKYDESGEGIIITGYEQLRYYLGILNINIPIQSQMLKQLADQLNAEIVLGTINNLKQGVNWLAYTYLYIRMLRNPKHYGISQDQIQQDPQLIKRRVNLLHTAATLLQKYGLIKYDRRTGFLSSTPLGKISSYYYIKYQSMAIYNQNLKPNVGLIDLFKIFSMSVEFSLLPIRQQEKSELTKLIQTVPIPIKGSPDDPATKISVLLQAYISRLPLDGYALNSDKVYITQSASRIMRGLFEICLRRGWGQAAQLALQAAKMVDKCMWNCMNPLRQFKLIPEYVISRLQKKQQFNWESFYQMSPQQIGQLTKFPKLGKILHKYVHQIPRVQLDAYAQPITRSCLRIDLNIKVDFRWQDQIHGKQEPFWLMVLDCDEEHILYCTQFNLRKDPAELFTQFTVPLFEILHPLYYIKVISDRWICQQSCLPLSFRSMVLPSKFPQSTQLQDLQPLPLSSLGTLSTFARQLKIISLNQIQTQIFSAITQSIQNVFIGASSGSGKFTLALMAASRVVENGKKVIIMLPNQESVNVRFKTLSKIFGKKIWCLTGQATKDTAILISYDIILTTPEAWDVMSRRWKTRKGFDQIGLFIIDQLHLIGQAGSTMQVVISRMRYISSQLQKPLRIIALASSVADYKDLAEWVGASTDNTFNFQPNVRQHPIEIIIQAFDQPIRQSRIYSMQKQAYQNIKLYNRSTLVIVNDRRQAKLTALDLVTLVSSDTNPRRLVKISQQQLKLIKKNIADKYLSHALEYGIAFIYEGMPETERQIVEQLFQIEAIGILVATYQLRWELGFKSFMVIVIDSTRFEGRENRWVDYSIPDMLQLMSCAATSEKDKKKGKQFFAAKFYIMCQSAKKDFYKKFLFEAYPVESSLNLYLASHLNAQIVAKTLQSKSDCVDWITWSFLYRRLTQNPNYYNLQEVTQTGINDYLSELIQNTVEYLEGIKCIEVEQEVELSATNIGIVCSHYYVATSTIAVFVQKLTQNLKLKNLIELLSESYQFEQIAYRANEYSFIAQKLHIYQQSSIINKAHGILLLHFYRVPLPPDLAEDCKKILGIAVRLIYAMVDIISSFGYLKPLILTMQLCQMIVQGMWINDSPLLQVMDKQIAESLSNNYNIKDIADFVNMEQDVRIQAMKGYQKQLERIASFCNRYPMVHMKYQIADIDQEVTLVVDLERDVQLEEELVKCPYYPKEKEQSWWIIVGQKKSNRVFTIKKAVFNQSTKLTLKFEPIENVETYTLYAICDSYMGCQQAQQINISQQ